MGITRRSVFCKISFLLLLFIFVLCSCHDGNSPSSPDLDKSVTNTGSQNDPGTGNLAGEIIGTIMQQPLTGVTVAVNSQTTQTDSSGNFRLDGVGEGTLVVSISGDTVYPRTTIVDTEQRRYVQLEAIETDSDFHLDFYRELARGNHPEEGDLYPLHRWTGSTPPTFYIDTNASATYDGVIPEEAIEMTREVITQVLPVFSGNVYTSASIQICQFSEYDFDAIPENSIVISFDDTLYLKGALGVTFTEPELISATTGSLQKAWIFVLNRDALYQAGGISREEITAHEIGHGFGYRHTSLLPSVMVKAGSYGGLFSEYDKLHMAVVYSRPAGNTDIDNDPLSTGKMLVSSSGPQVYLDQRANFSQPNKIIHRLQSLQSLTEELFNEVR